MINEGGFLSILRDKIEKPPDDRNRRAPLPLHHCGEPDPLVLYFPSQVVLQDTAKGNAYLVLSISGIHQNNPIPNPTANKYCLL